MYDHSLRAVLSGSARGWRREKTILVIGQNCLQVVFFENSVVLGVYIDQDLADNRNHNFIRATVINNFFLASTRNLCTIEI